MKYLKMILNVIQNMLIIYCHDRLLNKKPQSKICFHPPCYNKVKNDNYCDIHQDKKICNF